MYKRKYDPLPQFSESDSDIDIFNAKQSSYHQSPLHHRANKSCTKKIGYAFLVSVTIVAITVAVLVTIQSKSKKSSSGPTAQTECGLVVGTEEATVGNKKAYTFRGIPYAKPPVNQLRWNATVPLKESGCWKGIYKADISGKKCVQKSTKGEDIIGSEDCLYLDIYTPSLRNKSKLLPVFVWIHGGYLLNGYNEIVGYSPNAEFVTSMNVVGVSINYRLNAFGYLTLKELWKSNSNGNYGLLDQITALKWVQKNIRNFGGDSHSITVAGQSSGGTSIYALLASPLADGLFQKAIPMSGSPNFPIGYQSAAEDNIPFIKKSKCNRSSGTELEKCLYGLSAKEVYKSIPFIGYPNWAMDNLIDFPKINVTNGALLVIEPITLPYAPENIKLVNLSSTSKVSVLVGHTAQEPGIQYIPNLHTSKNIASFFEKRLKPFGTVTAKNILNLYENAPTYVSDKSNDPASFMYETITTDVRVTCPTNLLVKDLMKSSHIKNVYRYVTTYKTGKSHHYQGVTMHNAFHGIDSFALFGFDILTKRTSYFLTSKDKTMIKSIRDVVLDFMVNGTVKNVLSGGTFVFNGSGVVQKLNNDYHHKQCEVWNDERNGFKPYAWIN